MSILNYFSTSSSTSGPWKRTCSSDEDSSSSSDCGNTSDSTGDENSESSGSKASDTVSELFTTSSRKRKKRILSQAELKKGKTRSRPQGKVIARCKKNTKGGFNKKWLTEYPWLQYDCSEDLMYCKYCKAAKVANAYAAGTKNFGNTNLL